MGKRSRRLKRQAIAEAIKTGRGDSVPGGAQGALFRGINGQATQADVDYLLRLRRENNGQEGYSGMPKPNGYMFQTHTSSYKPKDDGVFHCAEANEVTAKCPLNPHVPDILIPITMWNCFLSCCKEYDTEWIALLKGKLDKDEKGEAAYVIESFYFPPQTASGAHVDVPTGVRPKVGTIGAIHSHVDMGVFWSGTDTSHSNWPVEIVINRKENYEALARFQLKCGEWAKGKAEVKLTGAYVSAAIDKVVQAAFSAGATLAAAARAKAPTSTTIIPPGVHPEDRAEVAEAIASSTVHASSNPTNFWGRCKACNHISHAEGKACEAKGCRCITYIPVDPCLTAECVRDKEHAGWHRRADQTYFRTEGIRVVEDDRPKVSVTSQAQLPLVTTPITSPETTTPATSITVPIGDDPTINSDEYCPACEGEGFVEEWSGNFWGVNKCPACNGDGLSTLGRVRRAELGTMLQ